jgi:hypothetical protein
MDLLLFVMFSDIVAVGPGGVAWRSRRVPLDGLKVNGTDASTIQCSADGLGTLDRVVLEFDSGRQIEGIWTEWEDPQP